MLRLPLDSIRAMGQSSTCVRTGSSQGGEGGGKGVASSTCTQTKRSRPLMWPARTKMLSLQDEALLQ